MSSDSRTSKSLKNSTVALGFYVVSLALQFVSRRVFIKYLGSEVLGLNTTAVSLLQFLNLAEMGIGAAIAFTLYKPIAENDQKAMGEIVAVQGWFYRKIAMFVGISAVVLSLFFPVIFKKMTLPIWYAYGTFGALLLSTLLSYRYNYKQILLSASQLEYKITIAYKLPKIVKEIAQIIFICIFPAIGYFLWILLEIITAIVATISLNRTIHRSFPFLAYQKFNGGILREKYPVILQKVKQLIFHKIGGFVLFQTSPLIIYAFTDLNIVAIYGNYMLIVSGLTMLLSALYNGLGAGVGNVVATAEDARVMSLFREIYSSRFFIVSICCFGFALCADSIISIWVGNGFVLSKSSMMLILLNMSINMMRPPIELFLQAKGMFNDIWAPVAEAILNIGLSVTLGYFWGLNGILAGISISLVCIIMIWKPYYLFRFGFRKSIWLYAWLVFRHFCVVLLVVLLWLGIRMYSAQYIKGEALDMLIFNLLITAGFTLCLFASLCFTEDGMRNFSRRLKQMLHI